IMTRDLFRRFWHDSLITRAHVLLAPGTDEGTVRAAISRGIGRRYRLQILSPRQLIERFAAEVRQGFAFTTILQAVTLLVVLLGILVCAIAAIPPARSAMQLPPADGLRCD